MNSTYKTIREIDGVKYITVTEHEELIAQMKELGEATNQLKEALMSIQSSTDQLAQSLDVGKFKGNLGKSHGESIKRAH